MSRSRVSALVDAACLEAKAKANRLDAVTRDLDAAETQRDELRGQLIYLQQNPPAQAKRAPLWLRIALDVGVGSLGAATGAVAGLGGPDELLVGLAVGAIGAIVARLILEVVWP